MFFASFQNRQTPVPALFRFFSARIAERLSLRDMIPCSSLGGKLHGSLLAHSLQAETPFIRTLFPYARPYPVLSTPYASFHPVSPFF
tara:strand:- start:262 stop:522 length:261 start_codon:yes stop_codon:yes gene_type:complete